LRRHERGGSLDAAARRELEARIDRLTAELEQARRATRARERLDAVTDALIGETDPDAVLDVAERWVTAALGRPCTVAREEPDDTAGCIALPPDGEPVAWLCIGGDALDEDDRAAADMLAARVGRALRASVSVTGRWEGFRTLERSLLPEAMLSIPGLQLASRYLPARGAHEVGGDFYDAVRAGEALTLIVGDVQGKGVEAATLTSLARHTLRAGAMAGQSPATLLGHLNTALLYGQAEQLRSGHDLLLRFVTAAVARITPKGDGFEVRVARAGQPPPIVVRSEGRFEPLEPRGVLLGVADAPVFEERTVDLAVGDTLILYTDGVIEQRNTGRAFSEQHLGMLVRNRRTVVDAEATAQLIEDTVHLVAPENVRDDVAILVAAAVPSYEA